MAPARRLVTAQPLLPMYHQPMHLGLNLLLAMNTLSPATHCSILRPSPPCPSTSHPHSSPLCMWTPHPNLAMNIPFLPIPFSILAVLDPSPRWPMSSPLGSPLLPSPMAPSRLFPRVTWWMLTQSPTSNPLSTLEASRQMLMAAPATALLSTMLLMMVCLLMDMAEKPTEVARALTIQAQTMV